MSDVTRLVLRWQLEWLIASMTIGKQMLDLFPSAQRQPVRSILPVMDLKKAGCVGPADLKT